MERDPYSERWELHLVQNPVYEQDYARFDTTSGAMQFGNQICEWPFFAYSDDGRHRFWSSIKERDFYKFMEDRYSMRDKELSSTKFGAIINYDCDDISPFRKSIGAVSLYREAGIRWRGVCPRLPGDSFGSYATGTVVRAIRKNTQIIGRLSWKLWTEMRPCTMLT